MKPRLFLSGMAVLAGVTVALCLLWLGTPTPVRADPSIHCVNATGTGCDAECGSCHASVQAAVDAAGDGHEIRIAGGTYAPGGTVAAIEKSLILRGGYSQDIAGFDPDMYPTVLDASWGGSVISVTSAGTVRLEHLTLTHGDGADNCGYGVGCGGGLYAKDTELFVEGCTVIDNVGSSTGRGWGGGIYVGNGAHGWRTTIAHSRIVSNTASTYSGSYGDGGGAYFSSGEVELVENEIADNLGHAQPAAMPMGGGIHLTYVTRADVLTNTIHDNRAGGSGSTIGGGIYIASSSHVYIAGNRIEDNLASLHGGGVSSNWSDVYLARNYIVGNSASTGGGLYIRSLTPFTVANNLIVQNNTTSSGRGVFIAGAQELPSKVLLVNNTIADHLAEGVATWGYATVTMTNNLITGNADGFYANHPASTTVSADTNLFRNVTDSYVGFNAIQQDPLLVAGYHPRQGSPALDAGLNVTWLTTDIAGHPRPWDGYDLGAYEGAWRQVFLPLVLR
jgi:hypothetical protein